MQFSDQVDCFRRFKFVIQPEVGTHSKLNEKKVAKRRGFALASSLTGQFVRLLTSKLTSGDMPLLTAVEQWFN
jgi:hypothetical protein